MKILTHLLVLLSFVHYTFGVKQVLTKYCMTPQTARVCREHAQSWGIDFVTRVCKLFTPDTCNSATGTTFVSEKMCQHMCLPPPQRKLLCSLMPKPGPCSTFNRTWYFDLTNGFCKSFGGGKCGTNPNAFASCKACANRCSHKTENAVCGLPLLPKPKRKKKLKAHAEMLEEERKRLGPQ